MIDLETLRKRREERCRKQEERQKAIDATYSKLKAAFKLIKKSAYITRMNFWCCMSCASSALDQMLDARPKMDGVVYFHKQDREHFQKDGEINIRYFHRKDGMAVVVAQDVLAALREVGLEPIWNGDPGHTITVKTFQDED
jgi:hypothetical protein